MPTRGLTFPTHEIEPLLSDKSKSLASLIACAAASAAGRFRMVVLNGRRRVGETMRRGIRAIAGSCYLHGHCLVGHAMAEIE